jgi:hypothetical protein
MHIVTMVCFWCGIVQTALSTIAIWVTGGRGDADITTAGLVMPFMYFAAAITSHILGF